MKMVTGNNCMTCAATWLFIFLLSLPGLTYASVNADVSGDQSQTAATDVLPDTTDNNDISPVAASEPKSTLANPSKLPEKKALPPQEAIKIGGGSHLASVALGLVLVVALILVLAWFMRRFNQGGIFNNSAIKIMAAMPLGTRERLLVVDVAGQQILLGVTATQINTLHVFSDPVIEANNPASSSDFGRKLLAVLQQKSTGEKPSASDPS